MVHTAMKTGAEEPLVSDFGDGSAVSGASARRDAGGARGHETLVPLIDNEPSHNSTHEEPDTRTHEPSVAAFGDRSIDSRDASPRHHPRRIHRKTLLLIFGQLLAAFLLVIGHFLFFSYLDGRLVEEVSVGQSWITASSLLLVTLVKGALTMCVGTSFVQHLWCILQKEYTSLEDIERMFNLRGSLLAMLNPQALWKSPLLFSIGVYLWLLTVALIYPPGALVVSMDACHSLQSLNMSVLGQSFPDNFDPLDYSVDNPYPSLGRGVIESPHIQVLNSSMARLTYGNLLGSLGGPLMSYAKFIRSVGKISRIEPPPRIRNSSYVLEYDAPQLNCTESDRNTTSYAPFHAYLWEPFENVTTVLRSYDVWNFRADSFHDTCSIDFARYLGYIPQVSFNLSTGAKYTTTEFDVAMQIHSLTCKVYSATYRVNITNRDASQNLTYTVHGHRALNVDPISFTWTDDDNSLDPNKRNQSYQRSIVPRQSNEYKDWTSHQVKEYLRDAVVLNLFGYAFGSIAGYLGTFINLNVTQGVECMKNGWVVGNKSQTRVDLCPLDERDLGNGMGTTNMPGFWAEDENVLRSFADNLSPIQDSALNTRRFDGLESKFNPFTDLNITSASLNELLANFSISALTQNRFFGNVTVDVEEYRNVYHFVAKRGFWTPYALCLAIAAVYAFVALMALRKSGVPAADGGFLQVMMTTRGETEMERLVVEQGPKSVEEIRGELAALRVRLGEMTFEGKARGTDAEGCEVRRRMVFQTESEYEAGRKR